MRIKQYCSLFLAIVLALGLCGCNAAGIAGKTALSIQPAQLTAEEEALAKLLDVSMDSYRIFDFEAGCGKEKEGRACRASSLPSMSWRTGSGPSRPRASGPFPAQKAALPCALARSRRA